MTWVFGFGSLMWDAGFPFEERRGATLRGYQRVFCMESVRNRGTPENPGMMLGLIPGGECTGIAYRLAPEGREAALAYLDEREGDGKANRRVMLPVRLAGEAGRALHNAWSYLPVVSSKNWVGKLPLAEMLPRFCAGPGRKGTCYEYLERLLGELAALGAREPGLEALKAAVDDYRRRNGGTAAGVSASSEARGRPA